MALRTMASFNNIPGLSKKNHERILDQLAEINADWITKNIGLDYIHGLVFNLMSYDDYGKIRMSDDQEEDVLAFLESNNNPEYFYIGKSLSNPGGVALHKHCSFVLEEALGRPLKASDANSLLRFANPEKKYHAQQYLWEQALLERGYQYFESPELNEKNRKRLLEAVSEFLKLNKRKNNNTKSKSKMQMKMKGFGRTRRNKA